MWVYLYVADLAGRPAELGLKVRLDVVEWWLDGRAVAMTDRELLAAWLDAPEGTFAVHDLTLSRPAEGFVVEVDDRVQPSLLDPDAVRQLRARLRPA